MELLIFMICSVFGALAVNFLGSVVLSHITRRKATLAERVSISSIEDANKVSSWGKRTYTDKEKLRLWSDAMNIVMTAESPEVARRYVEQAAAALGDEMAEFRAQAGQVLEKRFGQSAGRKDQIKMLPALSEHQ